MTLIINEVTGNVQKPSSSASTYKPDQLIAGRVPQVTDNATLVSGVGAIKRGTVLGVISASGKYTVSATASTDGSEVPTAILVDDADSTSGDVTIGVYELGEFNMNAITIGTGWSLSTIKSPLRSKGIYLKPSVIAADPS